MIQTVGVDFDGVIHSYEKGWQDGTIYGTPMPGAFDALERLREKYAVFIHTTRNADEVAQWIVVKGEGRFVCRTMPYGQPWHTWWYDDGVRHNGQPSAIAWSTVQGVQPTFWNDQEHLLITERKLPAIAYIDDRGIRFHNWEQALNEFEAYHGGLDD
jgi:hypothetical protein